MQTAAARVIQRMRARFPSCALSTSTKTQIVVRRHATPNSTCTSSTASFMASSRDRRRRADLATPLPYSFFNHIPHLSRLGELLCLRPLESGGIGKTPMQPRRHARKNRTPFRARFIAHGDDMRKRSSRLDEIIHSLGLILG